MPLLVFLIILEWVGQQQQSTVRSQLWTTFFPYNFGKYSAQLPHFRPFNVDRLHEDFALGNMKNAATPILFRHLQEKNYIRNGKSVKAKALCWQLSIAFSQLEFVPEWPLAILKYASFDVHHFLKILWTVCERDGVCSIAVEWDRFAGIAEYDEKSACGAIYCSVLAVLCCYPNGQNNKYKAPCVCEVVGGNDAPAAWPMAELRMGELSAVRILWN